MNSVAHVQVCMLDVASAGAQSGSAHWGVSFAAIDFEMALVYLRYVGQISQVADKTWAAA